jgi:hypothetical protein
MAAGSTYTPIATYTVSGSTVADVSFTSISGYTDIVGVLNLIPTGSGNALRAQVNNDASTIYSRSVLYGNGSSALSTRNTGMPDLTGQWGLGSGSSPLMFIFNYQNYSNSTTNKSILWRVNDQSGTTVGASVSLYPSTSAITQINYKTNGSGYFAIGSTFTLYGIAAA